MQVSTIPLDCVTKEHMGKDNQKFKKGVRPN